MNIRNLMLDEPIPPGLNTGFENLAIDPTWAWVAEESGNKWGIILASPCHGLVYLARWCVKDGAPMATAALLLRGCVRDCEKRGYKAYFTHVDPASEVESQMIGFCRRAKGVQSTAMQVLIAGSLGEAAKY